MATALREFRGISASWPSLRESVQRYLNGIDRFVDPDDAAIQVVHACVPAPIFEDRLSSKQLQARETTKALLDLVVATINDGRLDGYWMQGSGFNYHAGLDYCQVELAGRRVSQAVRITSAGAVLMRERWTDRVGYPYGRFQRLLEATIALSQRAFARFKIDPEWIAIQSTFHHARNLPLGIVTDFGTYFYSPRVEDLDSYAVPAQPLLQRSADFLASSETADLLAKELRTFFGRESTKTTGIVN